MADDVLADIPAPPGLFPDEHEDVAPTPSLPPTGAVSAARAAADPHELLSGDADRVEQQVLEILAAAQHRDVTDLLAQECAANGSPVLDSMDAVFVVQVVEQAVGGPPLALRDNSEPDDFHSTLALARLLRRLLRHRRAYA